MLFSGRVQKITAIALLAAAAFLMIQFKFINRSTMGSADPKTNPEKNRDARLFSGGLGEPISAEAVRFHPKEGMRYAYRFKRKIEFHAPQGKKAKFGYEGRLYLDVLRADEQGFTAIATDQLTGPAGGENAPAEIALKVQMDSKTGSFSLTDDPSTRSTQAGVMSEGILKDLIANWAFASGRDTVGEYDVHFEVLSRQPIQASQAVLEKIQKTKTAYRDPDHRLPRISSSVHVLEWNKKSGMPNEISGQEKTLIGEGRWEMSAEGAYSLQFEKTEGIPAKTEGVLPTLNHDTSLALSSGSSGNKKLFYGNLNPPRVPQVLDQLKDLSGLSGPAQLHVFGDLLRLLRAGSLTSADLLALAMDSETLKSGVNSPLFKTIVGALASLGTPEAQAAVLQIYQDPNCPTSGKGAILVALTTASEKITDSTRVFLDSEMNSSINPDLARGAAYALGAALRKAPDDSQTKALLAEIHLLWSSGSSSNSGINPFTLLDMMGNSGQGEYLPELTSAIENTSNLDLKAKAVFALRFIPADEAKNLLASSLLDNPTRVRQAAIDAIGVATWSENFRPFLEKCSASEIVASIQTACQAILARNP